MTKIMFRTAFAELDDLRAIVSRRLPIVTFSATASRELHSPVHLLYSGWIEHLGQKSKWEYLSK